MRKVPFIPLAIAAALQLSGCASLWKTMGVATVSDEEARQAAVAGDVAEVRRLVDELAAKTARIEELEKAVAELGASVEAVSEASAAIEELKALAADLQSRNEAIPEETLRKLSEIINAAIATP